MRFCYVSFGSHFKTKCELFTQNLVHDDGRISQNVGGSEINLVVSNKLHFS